MVDKIGNVITLMMMQYGKINNMSYEDTINYFQYGHCGILAKALEKVFPSGKIYKLNNNHLIFKYKQNYFDSRGFIEVNNSIIPATEEDYIYLIPFYNTPKYHIIKKEIGFLVSVGSYYLKNGWFKTEEYINKRSLKLN